MQLATDVANAAKTRSDGTANWDRGDPHLNTAFAVLTLLNTHANEELIDDGLAYLIDQQQPTGAWDEAVFFIARADSGVVIEWESASLTTAIVLEALCRARLHAQ